MTGLESFCKAAALLRNAHDRPPAPAKIHHNFPLLVRSWWSRRRRPPAPLPPTHGSSKVRDLVSYSPGAACLR
ncbi:hypothetical protein ZWY2020_044143 [Hordeum vulgare]|nr:hypothetical protein ZWY2020_044143 [Hordeum vulgare]